MFLVTNAKFDPFAYPRDTYACSTQNKSDSVKDSYPLWERYTKYRLVRIVLISWACSAKYFVKQALKLAKTAHA